MLTLPSLWELQCLNNSNGDPNTEPQHPSESQGWTMLIFLLLGRESPYGHPYSRQPISHWLAKSLGPPLSCFLHPGSSPSGLSHGEPSPICWNRTSQAAPIVVWAASPPACCCWKKAVVSIIGLQHPSTCQSLHWGVGGGIWKESHLKQAIWREMGRMEEGNSPRSPTEQSQATLCPHFCYSPAFPHGRFRPICPTVIPSPAPGPWRNASIPPLCSSAFWVPPGPFPRCTNLPAGGWLAGRQCKLGKV